MNVKTDLVENIRACIPKFKFIYVFSTLNSRTTHVKDVRDALKGSRFFFGKNRVMQLALGRTPEEEIEDNLSKLTEEITGNCGLLFTNQPKEEVINFFEDFKPKDFARSGQRAIETLELPKGPLPKFSHVMEPHLRKLGLPTTLVKGAVHLSKPFVVCEKGDVLTPEQANILKLLEVQMSEFKVLLKAVWSQKDKKVEKLKGENSTEMNEDEEEGDNDDEEEDLTPVKITLNFK